MSTESTGSQRRSVAFRPWLAGAVTLLFVAMAHAQSASADSESVVHFRTVHSFAFGKDPHSGGARPRPPMLASDGNLYGVSYAGGQNDFGTVYRVKPSGAVTTVHSFNVSDGYGPEGTLIQASDGNLYGVTSSGGVGGGFPAGTVFRLDPAGVLTTLHTFRDDDGGDPGAGLVQASDGRLYGTTSGGGQYGHGTVYRIALDGTFEVMYHFGASRKDGQRPLAPLIQTRDGHLCGTTYTGGRWGGGTVYCMTLDGQMTRVHGFGAQAGDANGSTSPLIEGDDGSLYGTSNFGGSQDQGALFLLRRDGSVKVMDVWARPSGGLLKASDGNFYGTVFWGGASDKGWVYRLTPSGKLTEVHSFSGPDGAEGDGELVEGTDGRLYGVTEAGGTTDSGVLFSIAGRQVPRPKR
ncbi:choice-of-anchor tandem repeat GloVer-containing protein [Ideonella sp.]|uniref:choice-of-anchor tandem repeat GloVer-containing protein n=1 Tax=Ideonella sp. TaxID=1929293 RepID=UPI0035B0A7B1